MFDMKRLRPLLILIILGLAGYGAYYYMGRPPTELVLTGIVTTNDVVVSPQISGQIGELKVVEGDTVKKDQLIAVIRPDELQADTEFYSHSAAGLGSQVRESEAALRFQERQTGDQIKQAEVQEQDCADHSEPGGQVCVRANEVKRQSAKHRSREDIL